MTNAIKELFRRYDKDRSGFLSYDEFGKLMEEFSIQLGINIDWYFPSMEAWKTMAFMNHDTDGDCRISPFEIRDLVKLFMEGNYMNLKKEAVKE